MKISNTFSNTLSNNINPKAGAKNFKNFSRLLLISFAPQLFSMQGTLDTSFNIQGTPPGTVVSSQITGFLESIAIQSNGQIVAGGQSNISGPNSFTLARYNTSGSLDINFGTSGIVTTQISGSSGSRILSIAIQTDGKILAGGFAIIGGVFEFALARYNTNGTLDTNFGTNGVITTIISGNENQINSIAIQPNGQIVAGGYATISGGINVFALARYNTNGTLDVNFGTNGIVATEIPGSDNSLTTQISSIALQPNGQIVAGGYASSGGNQFPVLVRYSSNGTFDTTFGTDGFAVLPISGNITISEILSVTIQTDGKIVAAGEAVNGLNTEFAVARLNTNGTLDTSFDTNGIVNTQIGTNASINSITMQSDGKIVVGGFADISGLNQLALARYTSNGSLDSSFGTNGIVTTAITGSTNSKINSIAMQSNGQIVAGGFATISGTAVFALARYNANTSLTQSPLTLALKNKYYNGGTGAKQGPVL